MHHIQLLHSSNFQSPLFYPQYKIPEDRPSVKNNYINQYNILMFIFIFFIKQNVIIAFLLRHRCRKMASQNWAQ